jgi:uncharacterized protein YndB with AHSA1/START domain
MEQAEVERSIWIAAPIERVWAAVTDPAQLSQWFAGGSRWEIPILAVGATALFDGTDVHIIEVLNPPHEFTLRWVPEPPTAPTVTQFLLQPEGDGTRFTVRESGYSALPADVRQRRIEQASDGYRLSLEQLAALLDSQV